MRFLLCTPLIESALLKMWLKVERSSLQFLNLNLLRTKRNENWTFWGSPYSITIWLVYVIVRWPDQGPSTQNSLWKIIRLSQSPSLLISENIKNLPLALRGRKKNWAWLVGKSIILSITLVLKLNLSTEFFFARRKNICPYNSSFYCDHVYMLGGVTRHMLPHLPGVPHLHVNRP